MALSKRSDGEIDDLLRKGVISEDTAARMRGDKPNPNMLDTARADLGYQGNRATEMRTADNSGGAFGFGLPQQQAPNPGWGLTGLPQQAPQPAAQSVPATPPLAPLAPAPIAPPPSQSSTLTTPETKVEGAPEIVKPRKIAPIVNPGAFTGGGGATPPLYMTKEDEEHQRKILEAQDQQQAAIHRGVDLGMQRSAEESTLIQQRAEDEKKRAVQMQLDNDEHQKVVGAKEGELNKATDDYMNSKVDNKRLWNSMGDGQKVGAVFAMILGGFGTAKGGVNPAVATVTKFIDKDIETQERDLDRKGQGINMKRGLLSDMRARFKDDREAKLAARSISLDANIAQLQAVAAKYKGTEAEARANEALAVLAQENEKTKMQLTQQFEQNALRERSINWKGVKPPEVPKPGKPVKALPVPVMPSPGAPVEPGAPLVPDSRPAPKNGGASRGMAFFAIPGVDDKEQG